MTVPKFKDYPHFRPDYTPKEMFKQGIFGGVYFRPIYSTVNKKNYSDLYMEFDFLKKLDKKYIDNGIKEPKLNKFKVNASLPLEYWEKAQWIHPQDPYGHLLWYCRFYAGRRTDDDNRQISRMCRVLLRFGQKKEKTPRVKQTLLHWGWDADKDHTETIKLILEHKLAKGASKVKTD